MKDKIHPIAKKLGYDSNESFYLDFPTQEAFQKFEMGGDLNNVETSNSTQYAPDADFFNSPDSPASSSNSSVATGAPRTIKQKPTITVTNPNDPGLKAYQDSLALNQNYFKSVEGLRSDLSEDGRVLSRTGSTPFNRYENRSLYDSDRIKPSSIVEFGSDGVDYAWGFPYYVPPVQPYKLKQKEENNTTSKPVEARVKKKFDKMPLLPFSKIEVNKSQLEPNLEAREVPKMKTSNIKDSNVYTASKMLDKLGKSTGYTNEGMNQGRKESTEFKIGGYLYPKQKYNIGGVTPLPVDVPTSFTDPVKHFTPGTSAPATAAPGGFKLPNLSGLGGGQQASQQSGSDPNAPVKKNTGKTIGGIAGGIAGVALAPFTAGISTVVGPALGSAIGGGIDNAQYKNKTEDYNSVKSSQQNAMTSNINGNFAQKQFKAGGEIGELFTDFKGYTHEDGGVTFPGTNIEVEKNETKAKLPDGRKVIFTNSPEIPYKGKRTYAQEHRSIEKKYFRNDLTDMNTKKRLIPKLFEDQEMKKEQMQAMMLTDLKNQYMMYGGKLRMAPGGELPTELLGLTAQGAGDFYNVAQGMKGADPVNFERMNTNYQYVDPRGAIDVVNKEVTSAYNSAKNAVRNTTSSAGEYLANMTNLSSKEAADRAANIASIKNKYDVANTQGLNQSNLMKDEYNARTQMAESVARQQEQDAARSSISTGLSGFGAKVAGFNNAKSSWNNQNDLLSLMHSKGYYPIWKDGKMGWTRDGVTVVEEPNIPSGFTPPAAPPTPPTTEPPKK
jgi:hypothetical protein